MVGASFALALARQLPASSPGILLVEALAAENRHSGMSGFDARSTALSYGSSGILRKLQLWNDLRPHAEPINSIHVSDRGHFGTARLQASRLGVEALGYVLENRALGSVFNQALENCPRLTLLRPATVSRIVPDAEGMILDLDLGTLQQQVHCQLVVLADGGRSPLCRQLGIVIREESYHQQAIISNLALADPHGNVAFERFTDSGPLAMLPLPDLDGEHRVAVVWTVAEAQAAELMALDDAAALSLLQRRFGFRLGQFTRLGSRQCYPLSLVQAREQIRPGLVLLGNAAHTLHPVAGQGFNLALRDADALANRIAEALQAGDSPGAMGVLQKFLDDQQGDQHRTIDFSHHLTRLFSTSRPAAVLARKSGLAAIDLIPMLKHEFARQAMGLADR